MSDSFAGGRLTIDLGALAANWSYLARLDPTSECAAVVKADAYGLGIAKAAPALARAGAKTFFVAHLSEARAVRDAVPNATIYVLNGLPPGASDAFAAIDARPVLGCVDEILEWAAFRAASGARGQAAVHVDTGMTRLGLDPDQARDLLPRLPFTPALLMSHLACADEPLRPETERQRALFAALRAQAPGVPASLANSAGTLLKETDGGGLGFDLRRPGVALYGANPIDGRPAALRSVVRLEARVAQVREAPAGAVVGYGGAERLRRRTKLAIVSVGYADGVLRAGGSEDGSPGAAAAVGGVPCPYVGRISMDLIAIDVTDAPETVARGGWVEILGDTIGVDALARACGTIGYEVLTGLGRRHDRRFMG
ncbi:alanine racemase [Methylopila sp. Yamaguchi]|uniref:alanine racemase n=1 Tax=Methylopila sp. Yamaguchi TaxID=1437817 RepID=UPI000CA8B8CD|nr:alanine racemase [Methylopila sp. Yamaguchi]GBD50046.1 alanine racemase [Methylopila sp. Yamaguchi]